MADKIEYTYLQYNNVVDDWLVIDIVTDRELGFSSTVTSKRVEKGTQISDNITYDQPTLSIKGYLCVVPEITTSKNILFAGPVVLGDGTVAESFEGATVKAITDVDRPKQLLERLRKIMQDGRLLTLNGPDISRNNLVLTKVGVSQNNTSMVNIPVSLTFKEIVIVSSHADIIIDTTPKAGKRKTNNRAAPQAKDAPPPPPPPKRLNP